MESNLLNAAFTKRENLFLILQYIKAKEYSREFQILIGKIKDYYERDAASQSVDRLIFTAQVVDALPNKKHAENFKAIIDDAFIIDGGQANVEKLILDSIKNETATALSVALINKDHDKVDKLLEEFLQLRHYDNLEDLNIKGTEILDFAMFDDIMNKRLEGVGLLKLWPNALNERLGGKLGPGHHIVTFANVEMGKTALNVTIACGFARQGAKGLYFLNEDKNEDVWVRFISNLIGWTEEQIRENLWEAKRLAQEAGLENIILVGVAPGNKKEIEALIDRFRPAWVVIDQMRNLDMDEQNKVLQLEKASTFGRNMAKKYNCIVVSTTQAADSATGKRRLELGDVDFSNVGVAAQADVLIGLGGTEVDIQQGIRYITTIKNKLTGRHETFPVRLNPFLSRYLSINEV